MRPITPEDLWKLRRVGQPEPLPGGEAAVVPVTTYEVAENRGRTRLHLVTAAGESRRADEQCQPTESLLHDRAP